MRTSLSTELLKVADERELSRELRRMDFVMPDRNKRTKDQVEVHGIVQLLATLSDDYWHFPIRLVHRDRPDFLIETHTRRIGVEHVEVVSPLEAKMDGLRAEGHGAEVHFIRRAAIGEPIPSKSELIEQLAKEEKGEETDPGGWYGYAAENDWAQAMAAALGAKATKARSPDFKRYDEAWLIMYDNWRVPGLDPRKAAARFQRVPGVDRDLNRFERVFVMDDRRLWEFCRGPSFHALRDS